MKSLVFVNQYGSTPDTGFGGRYFYIASELAHSCEVMLVTVANHHLLRTAPEFRGIVHDEIYQGVRVRWVKLLPYSSAHSPIRVINWFLFALLLPLLLVSHKYHSIHFSSPAPVGFLGAWVSARLKRASLVFDVRDVWPETLTSIGGIRKSHPLIKILSWIESFAYARSDHITSNLPNFDVRLRELKIDTTKFSWVPNGVSLSEASRFQEESSFLFPYETTNKKIVCYTGTLGEANALGVMLDAAVQLKDKDDICFVFVGDGKLRTSMERFIQTNELNNCVFLGALPKSDIYRVQSLADVLCIGALKSPLYRYGVAANKLYEYLYSDTPVVYYIDTPSYSPVVDAGCGIEVHDADGASLAAAIVTILADPESYRTGGGSRYVTELHSYKNIAARVASLSFKI